MERVQSSAFIFHRKLHKLSPLTILLIMLFMLFNEVQTNSISCNTGIRSTALNSDLTKGYVRVEKVERTKRWRVVATEPDKDLRTKYLQQISVEKHYFLLYDPEAEMFICWNPNFSNLVARRYVSDLDHCKFMEKVSNNRKYAHTWYVTPLSHHRHRHQHNATEIRLQFNKAGLYPTARSLQKCLRNRQRKDTAEAGVQTRKRAGLLLNALEPSERMLSRHMNKCANSDFMSLNKCDREYFECTPASCNAEKEQFCRRMSKLRKKLINRQKRLVQELETFCHFG